MDLKISDLITQRILQLMEQTDGTAEIQRNDFAQQIGCVPSQINYVLTSRFTPEQGYAIESRRGGGGYIKITRITTTGQNLLMHVINTIGDTLDENTARILLENLTYQQVLTAKAAQLIFAAVFDKSLRQAKADLRDSLRATIFKNMLLCAQ